LNYLPFEQKIKDPGKLVGTYLLLAEQAQKTGYVLGEMEAYENASLLYYYLGKYDLELKYALKAIKGFKKLGKLDKLAKSYGELGYRMKRHDLSKAMAYMRKGMRLAQSYSLEKVLMGIYDNYGVLQEMQLDYDSAYIYYTRGLELKRKYNDRSGLPYSLNNLGGLMVLQNKLDRAKPYFEEALQLRKKMRDTLGICETFLILSDIYTAEKNLDLARTNLDFVIQQAGKKRLYVLLSSAYNKRAKLNETEGKLKEALSDERNGIRFKDSLTNESMRNKLAELQVQFETQEKEYELLNERLKTNSFRNWLWVLGLTVVVVLLSALSIQFRRTSEKRRLELQNLKDLEFERMRISRDLHDNIGAELTLITTKLDIKAATSNRPEEQTEMSELAALSREASVLLRETIWSIRQDAIKKSDLLEKIEQFATKRAHNELFIRCEIECDATEEIASANALHIYRIAQEAINNAVKYSKATSVVIRFTENSFCVSDNGLGFDLANYTPGYGVQNMKQRAEEMGAEFAINSASTGTSVRILNY
jgi:signal transduction histidine kinase